ncbi:MAG: glycosyltransferase [Verrucomicrobia bacterium]|nr:glycosyltransferase [Verrucomicrobiota bacterium]
MKILLACQQSPHRYPIPAYGFWRTYFVEGLREAGHEVVEVEGADWARGLIPLTPADLRRWRDETWSRTLDTIRANPDLDFFLGYLYPRQIEYSAIRELQRLGLPAVNFFCDNVREYRRLPGDFAPFDLHWVPEHAALPMYAARGWPALFAPMPCWVAPARRHVPEHEDQVVSFIGRRDPLRAALLAAAAEADLPLIISGGGWVPAVTPALPPPSPTLMARLDDWIDFYRRQGFGPAWQRLTSRRAAAPRETRFDFLPYLRPEPGDEAYAAILRRSAVTLGINRYPQLGVEGDAEPTYSRLRDLEAPMLGACYLTEWAPELPQLYDLGREIEVYRNAGELIGLAQALLADPARRRALRTAGLRRAHADHSVGATVGRIIARLGLG